jgi:hypothetical protein
MRIFHGRRRVELRAEFFNITNTPKWRNRSARPRRTSVAPSVTNAGFGHNYNVAGERQIRFGLRFSFQRARDFSGYNEASPGPTTWLGRHH